MMKETIKNKFGEPLYKNAFFIILNFGAGAFFGFFFWIVAAKLYPKEDIGIATGIISASLLIVTLSRLGFDTSIIRFFPKNDKNKILNTAISITTFSAILFGLIFVLFIDFFSPKLSLLKSPFNMLLFLFFVSNSSVSSNINSAYVALRNAKYQFYQGLINGFRVLFLFPLVFLGAIGIFSALGISTLVAVLIMLFFLSKIKLILNFKIDTTFLRDSFRFSTSNYFVSLFITSPNQILPLIIISVLGPAEAAHYYIVFSIASMLFVIPNALGTSLFVEGSHGETLKKNAIKSLITIMGVLIPLVLFISLFGSHVLNLVGKDYSENGFELLKILSLTSILLAISSIFTSIKRVQKDMQSLLFQSGLVFFSLLIFSYLFAKEYGLIGIGYAWVLTYTTNLIVIVLFAKKEKWF